MKTTQSKRLMKRAQTLLPGGVNSPVRAFGSVGGQARVIERASGARIQDVDGNRYIDYVASWGAVIVGHAHPVVVEAVRKLERSLNVVMGCLPVALPPVAARTPLEDMGTQLIAGPAAAVGEHDRLVEQSERRADG